MSAPAPPTDQAACEAAAVVVVASATPTTSSKRCRSPAAGEVVDGDERDAKKVKLFDVRLARMTFVGQYKKRDGFTAVFPNSKHANRTDGVGLAKLSPMALGPVLHGMKGVPVARNLENMHQFSKQYENESKQEFEEARAKTFQDPTPKRHKRRGVKPKGWIWENPADGKRHCLSWVPSRQFYCNWYERLWSKGSRNGRSFKSSHARPRFSSSDMTRTQSTMVTGNGRICNPRSRSDTSAFWHACYPSKTNRSGRGASIRSLNSKAHCLSVLASVEELHTSYTHDSTTFSVNSR
jgi:hypothetical protein